MDRKELLINAAKEVVNFHRHKIFGCDYLSKVDYNNIEELAIILDELNLLIGINYELNYDGVEQDIGCLADDLRIEFNI